MVFAVLISIIANPIFILILLPYFLVWKSTGNKSLAMDWTIYTWCFLFLFVMFVLWGVRRKFFQDLDVSKRSQRPVLYFFGFILSIFYMLLVWGVGGPRILIFTIVGIMIGIIVGALVNLKIKVSVHVAAFTALSVGLSLVFGGNFVYLLLVIPVICWARVKSRRHTVSEVVAGGLIGGLLSWLMYVIYLRIF